MLLKLNPSNLRLKHAVEIPLDSKLTDTIDMWYIVILSWLFYFQNHIDECAYERVPCIYTPRGCSEKIYRKSLQVHQKDCPFMPVRCKLCKEEISKNRLEVNQMLSYFKALF